MIKANDAIAAIDGRRSATTMAPTNAAGTAYAGEITSSASNTMAAAQTIAARRPDRWGGQSATGATTTGTGALPRSRHTRTAQPTTTSPANSMPNHIARCGVHVILTVTGEVDGGSRHPLKPPEI